MNQTHVTIEPKILYYGTPVVLLTTLNEDGSTNISPISSSWALGPYVILGLGSGAKGLENVLRHRECVLNLPTAEMWQAVEALAPLTGRDPVPEYKRQIGFRCEQDKFSAAGLTPCPSELVLPSRIKECPLQLEAAVEAVRLPEYAEGSFAIVEARVLRVHAQPDIVLGERHVNPGKWHPLIYNFRHYFGLGQELGKTFRAET